MLITLAPQAPEKGRLSVGLAGKDDDRVTLLSHSHSPDTYFLYTSDEVDKSTEATFY